MLDSCRVLEMEGFKVTYLGVQKNGLVDLKELEKTITPETSLVSIMAVNNEIGVLQPVEEIGKLCRAKKVFFHTDAAQAVGKIPMNVDKVFSNNFFSNGSIVFVNHNENERYTAVIFKFQQVI